MKLACKQKDAIRSHYPTMKLRFKADGTVEAQKRPGGARGVLYTPAQTMSHLAALELSAKRTSGN
jgi:hypothetical protein